MFSLINLLYMSASIMAMALFTINRRDRVKRHINVGLTLTLRSRVHRPLIITLNDLGLRNDLRDGSVEHVGYFVPAPDCAARELGHRFGQ